jgi:hypothetical protein
LERSEISGHSAKPDDRFHLVDYSASAKASAIAAALDMPASSFEVATVLVLDLNGHKAWDPAYRIRDRQ